MDENARDVESIASLMTSVLTSLSRLYTLAEECADCENIQELLETVREHTQLKLALSNLLQLIGDHEYEQLENHLRLTKNAIVEQDDIKLALSITSRAFDGLPVFQEWCHKMSQELKANGVLEAKMRGGEVKAARKLLADKASSVEIEARQHAFVSTMRACGEARWKRVLVKIEKLSQAAAASNKPTSSKSKLKKKEEKLRAAINVEIQEFIGWCQEMSALLQEQTQRKVDCDAFLIKCAESGVEALARRIKSAESSSLRLEDVRLVGV